jgi:hypothetical protein
VRRCEPVCSGSGYFCVGINFLNLGTCSHRTSLSRPRSLSISLLARARSRSSISILMSASMVTSSSPPASDLDDVCWAMGLSPSPLVSSSSLSISPCPPPDWAAMGLTFFSPLCSNRGSSPKLFIPKSWNSALRMRTRLVSAHIWPPV